MTQIPNYNRYEQIINWWIEQGSSLLVDSKRYLYRLISKFGDKYDTLYSITNNTFEINSDIFIDITSTTKNKKIFYNDKFKKLNLLVIKNATGISINRFNKIIGNLFKNEILVYGKFKVIDIKESEKFNSIITIELESKQINCFSKYINRILELNKNVKLSDYTNNILENTNKLSINIDKLKRDLEHER